MLLHMQPTTDTGPTANTDPKNQAIQRLLDRGGLIDITTTGRRSGRPRRLEIVFHNMDGRIVISGMPSPGRTRAWIRNLEADPHITLHLKGPLAADLTGTARVITEPAERRAIAHWLVKHSWPRMDPDMMAAYSPMIEVKLDQPAG
jgi:deazaflavin-dependent oxidoreductase (nitroreductase family)